MDLQTAIKDNTKDASRPDFFELDSRPLHFPCSVCLHGNNDLNDAPCEECRYFFN